MKLVPNNWLYNAGLVGLLRILQATGMDVDARLSNGNFELQAEDLEALADAYCAHVLQASIGRFVPLLDRKDRAQLSSSGVNYTEMRTKCLEQLYDELRLETRIQKAEQITKDAINIFSADLKNVIEKEFDGQQLQINDDIHKGILDKNKIDNKIKELKKKYGKSKNIAEDKILKIKTGKKKQETIDYIDEQKYLSAHLQHFYFNVLLTQFGNY